MKLFLILVLCLSSTIADLPTDLHSSHYSQHRQTVDDAKRRVTDRLTSDIDGQQVVTSAEDLGYGVGIVGNSGSSSHYDSQHLLHNQPLYVSGGSAASTVGGVGPVVIPVAGGSGTSESYSEHSEQRVESGSPLVIASPSGGAESYSHQEHRRLHHGAPVVYTPSGASESYSRQEERRSHNHAAPLYLSSPSGRSESYSHHREERVNNRPVSVYYSTPAAASDSYGHTRLRTIHNQPQTVVINPATGASESYTHHSEKIVKSQPTPVYIAPATGSESYSQIRKFSSQAAPVIAAPTVGVSTHGSLLTGQSVLHPAVHVIPSSGSYSKLSENILSESQTAPVLNTIISPAGGSEYSHYSHKSSVSKAQPTVVYTSPAASAHSSYSSSMSSQNTGSNLLPLLTGSGALVSDNSLVSAAHLGAPLVVPNLATTSSLGSLSVGSSSGLDQYMTESERLARLQAGDIGVGGFRAGSAHYNSGLDSLGVSGLPRYGADGVAITGPAGYRSKAWEKSSKWSSGTQYGADGRPKSFSLLSTAESEQHGLNGKHAGYKAATTTLDDNGRVSTYSIHT